MAKNSDSVAHFFGGTDPGLDEPVNLTLETTEIEDEVASLEGEIALDMYQTDTHVIIVSPIAGVAGEDIDISYTDEAITIAGERKSAFDLPDEQTVAQEIYWGSFERTISLPTTCLVDKTVATHVDGVLVLKVPKAGKAKRGTIKVKPGIKPGK